MDGAAIQRFALLLVLFGGVLETSAAAEGVSEGIWEPGILLTTLGFVIGFFSLSMELSPGHDEQ